MFDKLHQTLGTRCFVYCVQFFHQTMWHTVFRTGSIKLDSSPREIYCCVASTLILWCPNIEHQGCTSLSTACHHLCTAAVPPLSRTPRLPPPSCTAALLRLHARPHATAAAGRLSPGLLDCGAPPSLLSTSLPAQLDNFIHPKSLVFSIDLSYVLFMSSDLNGANSDMSIND